LPNLGRKFLPALVIAPGHFGHFKGVSKAIIVKVNEEVVASDPTQRVDLGHCAVSRADIPKLLSQTLLKRDGLASESSCFISPTSSQRFLLLCSDLQANMDNIV
jgi:hypothetical protein